jgi:hypothetical protein
MTGNAFLDLLVLAIPASLVGFWWTSARARELAIEHARRTCQQQQLQFLDQTVSLSKIRLSRTSTGSSCFRREFGFEFTDYGEFRDGATVIMRGNALERVHFPYIRDEQGNRIYTH